MEFAWANAEMNIAPRGLTLVEVLIALAVIAVGLLASLKVIQSVSRDTVSATTRAFASLSADNALAETRLMPNTLLLPIATFECSQGRHKLSCTRRVEPTDHPTIRRVIVEVRDDREMILAERIAFIPQR